MSPTNWRGYSKDFLDNHIIPMPDYSAWKDDIATNKETGESELPFIYFSSIQSISRRVPLLTASNLFREMIMQISREGSFRKDDRIKVTEQLSTTIYSQVNTHHKDSARKMAKGHMTRREDVQWDIQLREKDAGEAAEATFHYTNASPQHQAINNGVWKELENSILIRGRSKEPKKATVFTGPVLAVDDPWLVISQNTLKVKCPLRFWKVIYYVNQEDILKCAGFLMSHKTEVEQDQYVQKDHGFKAIVETLKKDKPFLEFDERATYQVNVGMIEDLTKLKFHKASESLPGGFSELSIRVNEKFSIDKMEIPLVEGLVL